MRQVLIVGLLFIVAAAGASGWQVSQRDIAITIAPSQVGGGSATVPVTRTEMYVEGPFAFVEAPPSVRRTGASGFEFGAVSGLAFGVRAWRQGDKARVVVYAELDDKRAPDGRTQTPIATFTITPGQAIEVPETEKWGASRVVIKAVLR